MYFFLQNTVVFFKTLNAPVSTFAGEFLLMLRKNFYSSNQALQNGVFMVRVTYHVPKNPFLTENLIF